MNRGIVLMDDVKVEQLKSIEGHIEELSELLIQVVEEGASIGFLPPKEARPIIFIPRSVILRPERFLTMQNPQTVNYMLLLSIIKPVAE